MKLLLNFSTLKAGGGQNVALNFLNEFFTKELYKKYEDCCYMVSSGSVIENFLFNHTHKDNIFSLPANPLKRLYREFFSARRFIKRKRVDVIYTYFGYGLFPKRIPQIIGSAVSNIYFPEINFWEGYSGLTLKRRQLVDSYRLWGVKRAQGIIFETNLLEKRCHKLYHPQGKTITIQPSIFCPKETVSFDFSVNFDNIPKGLFLCGWQRNKQVMLIPQIAACLKKQSVPFLFVLTAPIDESPLHKQFMAKAKELNVEEYIYLSGIVAKPMLPNLYRKIDFVFLLSKLESFSNNIIEAWTYAKPLIASDEEWTHAICGNSAIYVERDNPEKIASCIIDCLKNKTTTSSAVEIGRKLLASYPTIEERTRQELNFIEEIYAQSH